MKYIFFGLFLFVSAAYLVAYTAGHYNNTLTKCTKVCYPQAFKKCFRDYAVCDEFSNVMEIKND